jgi:trans-2,3-dihydro-3-hydroxyanthranilate isomerase
MRLSFSTLDVFTDRRFGGNPLAVVHGAGGLTDAQMQVIAREFNLSETVFVLKVTNPKLENRFRCRGA